MSDIQRARDLMSDLIPLAIYGVAILVLTVKVAEYEISRLTYPLTVMLELM